MGHPEESYRDIGLRFGVKTETVGFWSFRLRKKVGTQELPLRTTGIKPSNLVALPSLPPKALDPELTSLARQAARNLLAHLGDKANFKGQPLRDIALALKTITDSYELLDPMDTGRKDTPGKGSLRLMEALLGKSPTEEADEEPDALAALLGGTGEGT